MSIVATTHQISPRPTAHTPHCRHGKHGSGHCLGRQPGKGMQGTWRILMVLPAAREGGHQHQSNFCSNTRADPTQPQEVHRRSAGQEAGAAVHGHGGVVGGGGRRRRCWTSTAGLPKAFPSLLEAFPSLHLSSTAPWMLRQLRLLQVVLLACAKKLGRRGKEAAPAACLLFPQTSGYHLGLGGKWRFPHAHSQARHGISCRGHAARVCIVTGAWPWSTRGHRLFVHGVLVRSCIRTSRSCGVGYGSNSNRELSFKDKKASLVNILSRFHLPSFSRV